MTNRLQRHLQHT